MASEAALWAWARACDPYRRHNVQRGVMLDHQQAEYCIANNPRHEDRGDRKR